jgi:YfiH family protein
MAMAVCKYPTSGSDVYCYQSGLLQIPHGMFCRTGGVGSPPFATLNLSFGVGDEPENVQANRRLVKKTLGLSCLVSATQVHGEQIARVDDISIDTELDGFDGLITRRTGIGLLIQQADCQAVLLHDPVHKAIGAVHSGWRGSVCNIIGKTVAKMTEEYSSKPSDIRAVISPSLGPCCAEFVNYEKELPAHFRQWRIADNHFDFWKISRFQLQEAGLDPRHIDSAAICTMCDRDFFSYRRAVKKGSPVTGRNGSVIALPGR